MPESHLIMRAWRDEDEVGILELEKAVWGETEAVDPAFFDWQVPVGTRKAEPSSIVVRLRKGGSRRNML